MSRRVNVDEGECEECHALIPWQKKFEHSEWHFRIDQKIEHIYSLLEEKESK